MSSVVKPIGFHSGGGYGTMADAGTTTAERVVLSDSDRSSALVARIISIQLVLVVVTQKLALPMPGGLQIAFAMLLQFGVFAIFAKMGLLRINGLRAVLWIAFCGFAIGVHSFYHVGSAFSPGSIFLLLLILSMLIFQVPIKYDGYITVIRTFQNVALAAAFLSFFNWATQFAGLGMFPNLNEYIPKVWQYINYVYLNKLRWDGPYYKPNGVFFLEVSHLGQFLGMALVIELTLFRRFKRMVIYASALVFSFGGTGNLLVLSSLPFILAKLPKKYIILGLVALPILAITASQMSVLDPFIARLTEFDKKQSSGYNRFVLPVETSMEALNKPDLIPYIGAGAGSIPKGDPSNGGWNGFAWPPYSKVIFEYGLIGLMIWCPFIIFSCFNRKLPFLCCWVGFIQYNFLNGSLNVPLNTVYICILSACYFITDESKGANQNVIGRRYSNL